MPGPRGLYLGAMIAVALTACGPTAADDSDLPDGSAEGPRAPAEDLVRLAEEVHRLELTAAKRLFGDSTRETEGDEHLRYSVIASSVAILRATLSTDSTNADGWYLLGSVLTRHAYRGFGSWNLDDQSEAVAALRRAQLYAAPDSRLRQKADSALAAATRTLEHLQGAGPSQSR